MKRLIAVLFPAALLFCGCDIKGQEIKGKKFTDRDCICQYSSHDPMGNFFSFEDSCSMYHVGDKIGK